MKINYIGVVATVIAFISLALPWWTMTTSAEAIGIKVSADVSVYPHQARASAMGVARTVAMELWFGWVALALIVIAGVTGIVGSVIIGKTGKMILIVAGILTLLFILIFAAGLQNELSKAAPVPGLPTVGLFSSGSWTFMGTTMDYSTYLSFGFWLALVAAIIAFISLLKHLMAPPEAPPTPKSR
ncbi:MAG: hypothetical protein AOA66_1680 [Candidatus Bathyarchaeota archaeon BA2]|nr:MAG: hypothetical protein AOA66_1680 [Candidatus Bathyarchaeota archaeon BA2]